ncbi:hypothetical protein LWC08_15085 [Desulfobaculum bizertense]|uniref:hypothetical protein n=1 Tax=Desulfobaculum bizertense TaxID=376490 RepID=UPI001F29A600|nr:hypothetical protein [Desulfobaculum bizertense]UIJ37990.1 hypothetical protein LWC08_15085 [Desulfobaculum bizertense]
MKRIWIGALGLCCLLLGACASQQPVQLNYSPDRWAESCTGEVQLEPMHDARKETQFIVREGKVLKTDRDVPGWIQSALRMSWSFVAAVLFLHRCTMALFTAV